MLLSDLKKKYLLDLSNLYPPHEIYSLFEWIAEHYLSVSRVQLHQQMSKNTQPQAEKKILAALKRLTTGEPIQYLLGQTEFYNININVNPNVLIPRPETEYLVDIILKELPKNNPLSIIDLCTGSGCIAIALAKNSKHSTVVATDNSEQALLIAKENALINNVHVELLHDDILNTKIEGIFDVIVSNPPYVRNMEKQLMHKNVLEFEPAKALFVDDADPLVFYTAIAEFAYKNLIKGGTIYLEINEYLRSEMFNLYTNFGFKQIQVINDLNNKTRFLKATR